MKRSINPAKGVRALTKQLAADERFRFQFIFVSVIILLLAVIGVYLTIQLISSNTGIVSTSAEPEKVSASSHETPKSNMLPITGWSDEILPVVALSETDVTLTLKDNRAVYDLSAKVLPILLADRSVSWVSHNPELATVDQNGHITAFAPGTAVITAYSTDGLASTSCTVKILQPVTGLYLTTTALNMYTNSSNGAISAVITPDNASNKDIIWNVADPSIAMVDDTGTVMAMSAGTTIITASSEDGGYSAQCVVTVAKPVLASAAPVSQIRILKKPSGSLATGSTFQMTASITGANRGLSVNWTSSDPNIASVDSSGVLSTHNEGTVTITASGDNSTSDSFILNINNAHGRSYNTKLIAAQDSSYSPSISVSPSHSASSGTGGVYYTMYPTTFDNALKIQSSMSDHRTIWDSGSSQRASESQISQYMTPANFSSGAYKFQFLDLSKSNGVDSATLNNFLSGKGVLAGQADAFLRASRDYNISEIYLAAHSALESGNGTSKLARGVEYNGVTVYNVYGIGAVDSNPLNGGAKKAYEMGWTTVEKAIYGGAAWISEKYIHSASYQQNTLYKMLWNPAKPGEHQYASDVGWAVKQAVQIKKIFDNFPNAVLTFDVPVYSGMGETPLY